MSPTEQGQRSAFSDQARLSPRPCHFEHPLTAEGARGKEHPRRFSLTQKLSRLQRFEDLAGEKWGCKAGSRIAILTIRADIDDAPFLPSICQPVLVRQRS